MKSNIDIPAGCEHSIANAGEETLVFVETTVGDVAYGQEDIIPAASGKVVRKGYNIEPLIKLQPAFKDYLWGGTKLRDVYGMNCDYDIIAEAWMMSAHIAGQSILDSGEISSEEGRVIQIHNTKSPSPRRGGYLYRLSQTPHCPSNLPFIQSPTTPPSQVRSHFDSQCIAKRVWTCLQIQ